ncbi:MAG: hypothetical protein A3B66_00950 [Alphaproteobacteria bacterium RIFCSPHIGHO2_02_FULL_46_13]|nr:MAG: hypothetical protein A3B66_00950 [Alphaproteobacteria bacterium RIFCSPHIGHO2_02_FULL_46_13]
MILRGFIAIILTSGLLISAPTYAAETAEVAPVIPTPLKVMPSKIKPVQTNNADELSRAAPEGDKSVGTDNKALEILSPRPAYGFQNDFWASSSRQDLVAFLSPPSVPRSKAARNLALRVTLTPSASLSDTKNPDENIYALRLKKLVELGSFDDAQKLYKLNESAPPTPMAAQSGIEASLGHGEIAVACLDQKTFDAGLKAKDAAFWGRIDTFCQTLFGPVAGDDEALRLANASRAYVEIAKPAVTAAADINKLDIISTIAMMESGRLSTLINSPENLQAIDDKHLAVLAHYAKPSAATIPLLGEAITRGIVANDQAIDFLKAIDLKDVSNPYNAFLKEYFKTTGAPVVTEQLLALATDKTREALLYPLYTSSDMPIPNGHKLLSLKLLALANQVLPKSLVMEAYGLTAPTAKDESLDKTAQSGEEFLIKLLIEKAKTGGILLPNNDTATLLALDYANYPQKDAKNAYDNLLSLTPNDNYVMPIGDILSSLKKSANQKQINQVVIRSLAIIDDKSLEQLHPVALYRILEALNSAGLNEETMSLTHEVLGLKIRN